MLENYSLPIVNIQYSLTNPNLIFTQYYANVHNDQYCKAWLNEMTLVNLPWPAFSADMNSIQHTCNVSSRQLHGNGGQFNLVAEIFFGCAT